jgi:hypothetical protein
MSMPPQPLKIPTMVIFWADSRIPLTYAERKEVEDSGTLISVTPREILIQAKHGRKVVVLGVTDPVAPPPPTPRMGLC